MAKEELAEIPLSKDHGKETILYKLEKYSVTNFLAILDQMNSAGNSFFEKLANKAKSDVEIQILRILNLIISYKDNIVILRKEFLETLENINSTFSSERAMRDRYLNWLYIFYRLFIF